MADLGKLRELCAWMRAEGVQYARVGELELRLGPPLPPVSADIEASPVDEFEAERRSFETLLHSSGADASPFLSRKQ